MKVVINKCYGGFSLSTIAGKKIKKLGYEVFDSDSTDWVHVQVNNENAFRSDPRVIKIIEKLGKKANGRFADLKIVDIPFDSTEGWFIDEYDGIEHIEPEHQTWG